MSFNQFSPELLIEVFSHLLDIESKILLERVSKRFRDCIKNVESWKCNTTLRMSEFASDEGLRSFLDHTKVVTRLELDCTGISSKEFAALFMFPGKLKIRHFSYSRFHSADCSKYDLAVACCFGKFAETLEFADLDCCSNRDCPTLTTIYGLLPLCKNLQTVFLGFIRDDEDSEDQEDNLFLLDSLMNKSLSTLQLTNFYSTINAERLAAVCNTAIDHSLSTLTLELVRRDFPPDSVPFQLAEFCQALEPEAACAIECLELYYIDCDWIDLLPTFPAVFLNLTFVEIMHCPTNPTAHDATKMAQSLGGFLHAGGQHEQPVALNLKITCQQEEERAFGAWLWNSIDLLEVRRSGTKGTTDMEHWKRTLSQDNSTVSIEFG